MFAKGEIVVISLIVPVYNVNRYIREFLDTVVNQTFKDFEAILVDDGSTDGTEEILDEYAAKYEFLKVIHKENKGVVSAWKRGIAESRGDYLTFADPDDILHLNSLEEQYRLITENNADLVISGIERLENDKYIVMPADNWFLEEGVYIGEKLSEIKKNLFGNVTNRNPMFFFAKWNKLFKREIIINNLEYSGEDVGFGDDVCISASAIYDSEKIVYTHVPLYVYRIRDDSLTTVNFDVKQIDNAANLINNVLAMITAKGYMKDFVIYNYPSYQIMYLIHKIGQLSISNREKTIFLKALKNHSIVINYNLKEAKKFIAFRRYIAIWLLQHNMLDLLVKLL